MRLHAAARVIASAVVRRLVGLTSPKRSYCGAESRRNSRTTACRLEFAASVLIWHTSGSIPFSSPRRGWSRGSPATARWGDWCGVART